MARPVAGEVEPDFPAVDVLDGGGVVGERAGDQVDQARLADTGSAGDQELERLVWVHPQPFGFPQQQFRHLARLPHEIRRAGRDKAGGRYRWLTRHHWPPFQHGW